MKIYTKTGDQGLTGLIGGTRILKSHIRIEAYGTVDELNSWIGNISDQVPMLPIKNILKEIQDRLFTIGSSLACDPEKDTKMHIPDLNIAKLNLDDEEAVIEFLETEFSIFVDWIRSDGKKWKEQLRRLMIQYRNIGHDWQFNDEQKELLEQYYDANFLLVECLNSDCYVSREVRQEIEETLLLPIEEIEKWKQNRQSDDRG
jgi:ATP:cob(I)alamin adenosyltransferase